MEKDKVLAETIAFRRLMYERYQLNWMIGHGYSVHDIVEVLDEIVGEMLEDGEDPKYCVYEAYDRFEADHGFNGSLWVCYDEFMAAEYLDEDFVLNVLCQNDAEKAKYREDVGGLKGE